MEKNQKRKIEFPSAISFLNFVFFVVEKKDKKMTRKLLVLGFGVAFCGSAFAQSLAVHPASAVLDSAADVQRLIVQKTRPDGVTIDVTAQATAAFAAEGIAAWDPALKIKPVGDGETTLTFTYEGESVAVPVKVSNAGVTPAMSFRNDVLPSLMRGGCNTGACHGSASGKNGFGLSLFGFEPAKDFITLTRDIQSRRMNVAIPEESLMLLKPLGAVDHEGGAVIEKETLVYNILHAWIKEGAQDDPADVRKLDHIEILPPESVIEGQGGQQRFTVMAHYSDGTDRDVTDLSVLAPSDEQTLTVDKQGLGSSGNPGEVYVMARFGSFAVVSKVIVIPAEVEYTWPDDAVAKNYIDEFVFAKLKKLRLQPATLAPDHVFIRRAFLDVIGSVPTPDESRAFLLDTDPNKRAKLIDTLLERPEFSDVWAMKWADVLRVSANDTINFDRKSMNRYNDWLREAITTNKPMDQIVRELLTAKGGNFTNPAANFYLIESDPTLMAENVAQIFMGVQMQCAQCHNHPFERWTMEDYYSFSAFFAQVGRKTSSDPRETIVFNSGGGEVKHIKTGAAMPPKFLGGEVPDVNNKDRREVLAQWLTSPENKWFAKNIANRVWDHFFGGGIVNPPDDVRVTNPPSNPQLHEELGKKMVEYNYDLRKMVRDICNSYTYQIDTKPRAPEYKDERNLAVARVRRLTAEQMFDSICKVTDTEVKFPNLPLGAMASQVADGKSGIYFLDVFGRPGRDSVCTCGRKNEPTLAQSLHLINGDTVNNAIKQPESRVDALLKAETPTPQVVEELYLAALSRIPSPEEAQTVQQYIDTAPDRRVAVEDAFWSVLNSKEFIFNH